MLLDDSSTEFKKVHVNDVKREIARSSHGYEQTVLPYQKWVTDISYTHTRRCIVSFHNQRSV